jgi:hypothetical protein
MLALMACRRDDDAAPIIVSPDGGRGAVATCVFRNDCIVAIAKTCPRGYTITHENAYVEMVADCH